METVLKDIIAQLRVQGKLGARQLEQIIRSHNKNIQDATRPDATKPDATRPYAKKRLLPYYLRVKETEPARWASWGLDEELEQKLLRQLQMKPRRTASGVATITVITKPWRCASDCLYCPSDVRMPKSYLSGEPACQRAERNYFDPYLQVASRLKALTDMGHTTDKIELIVLGGTWSDYPEAYQLWFITEVLRALNNGVEAAARQRASERLALYAQRGLSNQPEELAELVSARQQEVVQGTLSYNRAISLLYEENQAWTELGAQQIATMQELRQQQLVNENAQHRMVGLVIETRPDAISPKALTLLRHLGCTKIQMGVQSLNAAVLRQNNRNLSLEQIRRAFELVRLFGFKIQAHFMLNLYGSSCQRDKEGYLRFVTEAAYQPDEIKLYPCALVESARLCTHYQQGTWRPNTTQELMELLVAATLATPPFVRISRMIRDISADDILTGNKKTNLRQMVEKSIEDAGGSIEEIRYREIRTSEICIEELRLIDLPYQTTVSEEHFFEWVTPDNRIAGFLRLSLPLPAVVQERQEQLPIAPHEAMIREVHVYGKVARLHTAGEDAQHLGLGKQLIDAACALAAKRGYKKINVISAVGTRQYYRSLGFKDSELYQYLLL